MAGIGFELRRILKREDLQGLVGAYGLAGVLGGGPWLLSSAGILAVGTFARHRLEEPTLVVQFLVTIAYLMASSLVVAGLLQFYFTRFLADRIYERRTGAILPNLLGAIALTTAISGALGAAGAAALLGGSALYRAIACASFVVLCDLWVVVVFVSSLKQLRLVLGVFAAGYASFVLASMALAGFGLEGLLAGFFIGHAVLFFSLLAVVSRELPSDRLVAFEFLDARRTFPMLAVIGLLYNLALWADKIVFWLAPSTSEPCLGSLRFSTVYDLPSFLASLTMIPGMAVFLLRIEADFAFAWERFYAAIRSGESLDAIESAKDAMVISARRGMLEIAKVQGATAAAAAIAAPLLLEAAGISPHHLHLFRVSVVGYAFVVILVAALNTLFYLDKRLTALALTFLFGVANAGLSAWTLFQGPECFGYGFGLAALIAAGAGLLALERSLAEHEFATFMLQH
jgi:uncharacterized membrane protein